MESLAARNQALYQDRMKRRLEEHQRALQDWRKNLRIVPLAHRHSSSQVEGKAGAEMAS